ncbi:site-2 protease family protein [Nocardioides sp. CFH 31398]|uniref:M50 family metallopeptidase n=1 Tax=Nocardioides sp. CFH 31398 TaxID=2919579 RepID=UPI001F05963E|nr:site-2 protease family protein [Nocardioides sp. CFH 31398]MCH1868695.1 site-2 protease family protein [Nocardioides sp. CFH 31398]
MTALLYTAGVLFFVVAILVSIGLHELGHLVPARAFGAKVTQYFVGFGPTVWSKQVGETEWGVKAIPLGGYVKIVGMLPPGAGDLAEPQGYDEHGNPAYKVRKSNTGLFAQLVSDARAAEWELVRPEDHDRLFYKLAWWKKVVVMGGGPMVNIAIAFLIFLGVFATYGNPGDVRPVGTTVEEVSACVLPYDEADRACTASDPEAPAAEAGLRPGDVITSFNGEAVSDWDQLQGLIRGNSDGAAVLTWDRDGRQMSGETSTTVQARPGTGEDVDPERLTEVGFLGVSPQAERTTGGPLYTLGEMGTMAVQTAEALVTLPVRVYGVGQAILGLEERDPDSPVSVVGGGRIAGETASTDLIPGLDRFVFLLLLVAGFNFFIGALNLVPLLPLDGGHIAGALYEAGRRGTARLRRRPDPGYADVAKMLPVAYVVASALLVMGVVLIIGDLVVPLSVVPG